MNALATASERRIAIDDLDHAIVTLAANINASTYQLLVLVREFDERAGWLKWGFENCTQWLHWRCDLSPSAAREKVRVAHALKALPEVSAAFEKGALSYSKVRALTRVATPANEAALVEFALPTTAARVEERCQQMRNTSPDSVEVANRAHAQRSLRAFRDRARGTMTLSVELPIEAGELICQALDKAVVNAGETGPEFEALGWTAQQADALVTLARSYLGGGCGGSASTADAYQVVIHVDGAALEGGEGRSDLPLESVKRLSCDGSVVALVDGVDGQALRVGRKQRTVSGALRRALRARDRGCVFPGCGHTHFVDGHHVCHWADGGETSLENTILLCSRHHRLVHEGGYEIRKDHQGRWYFRRPDGRAVPAHGYRVADMVDEQVGATSDAHLGGASAEAPELEAAFLAAT